MPPKRTASTTSKKRKVKELVESDAEDDASRPPIAKPAPKRTKSAPAAVSAGASGSGGDGELAANGQPTNKALPVGISFPNKETGTIRIASWNVAGLAAAQKKGFKSYVEAEDPDILFMSETKVSNEPVDPFLTDRYPHRYWAIGEKKGHSGTAFLSKHAPLSVSMTLLGHPNQAYVKGRIITLEFASCWLIGTYVVNAGEKLKTLGEKEEWNAHFERYIRELDASKPVMWFGDLNVAPTALDIKNDKTNWNKTAGYTKSECDAYARVLNGTEIGDGAPGASDPPTHNKFVDVWRDRNPQTEHYTYWSYRFNCRGKGIGWRLDMFVVSERLVSQVKTCEIRSEIYGASDHCPIVLELEGPL